MKDDPKDKFIESANQNFKHRSRQRFIVAIGITAFCLILFIILGPDADTVNKKFEYIGAQGDLNIMDAISVVDGTDKVHQLPKSLQKPPPPSNIEIEKEMTHETGTREIPRPVVAQEVENPVIMEIIDEQAEEFTQELVSLATPMQNSSTYYIKHMIRPEYPLLEATETELQTEVIYVSVQFFVEKGGTVSASMIQSTNGGPAFTNEVLKKIDQWILGFYIDVGPGIWLQTTWNFKSPYFIPGQG
jgi:hypothetical protein